jgi:nucleotide-binding universal stress UspA family protein
MELARNAAVTLGKDVVKITLAHVGSDPIDWPQLEDGPHWRWQVVQFAGDPVSQILGAAGQLEADLIVMPTQGHDGILDMLRGSTTEQVLRMANCPVLAVPAR